MRTVVSLLFRIMVGAVNRLRHLFWRLRLADLGTGARLYPGVRIRAPRTVCLGRRVVLNDFVHIWGAGGVYIGDDTIVAAGTVITSQSHDKDAVLRGLRYADTTDNRSVRIGSNVWIGSSAVILPGVCIGDDAIVGAGAVVTRDVAPRTVVAGVPAKLLHAIDDGPRRGPA